MTETITLPPTLRGWDSVLQQIIESHALAEFNPDLVKEAFGIMRRFAPTLAKEPAIAGAWVRGVLIQKHLHIAQVRELCEAELAAISAMNDEFVMGVARDAFLGGAAWAQSPAYAEAAGRDQDETIAEAFARWWTKED
ncbi:MAG: hypothetical protein EPN91_00225 [Salinibacterium sp.]|nr:MAG: hypothetical protein EPN91_00225 [Salinibacterium sp.]